MPSGAVGQDVQQPPAVGHVITISRGHRLPPVPVSVGGVGQAEHGQQPHFAVAAVVGQGLA